MRTAVVITIELGEHLYTNESHTEVSLAPAALPPQCPAAQSALIERLKKHRFYHCIDLGNGVITAGIPRLIPQQQLTLRQLRRFDFAGKRVLDIGCRDGLFSFEAERLGAAEVIGIDNCISPGAVEVLIPHLKSKVRMYEMNLLDMTPETFGRFDIIICGGVLYHIRYPFQFVRVIRDLLTDDDTLLLETALWRVWESQPLLYCPASAESPYESSSVTFFNSRGLIASLESLGFEARFTDNLFGSRIFRTPGTTARSWAGAGVNAVQRIFPRLVSRVIGQFFVDRGVFVCRRRPGTPAEFAYWDWKHNVHN
jgi:tRNA (mo5U34)-methyltransferase